LIVLTPAPHQAHERFHCDGIDVVGKHHCLSQFVGK